MNQFQHNKKTRLILVFSPKLVCFHLANLFFKYHIVQLLDKKAAI